MKIEVKRMEDKLTLKLKGRLDTTTAPKLEEALKNSLADVTELRMDFLELEYLSSAGLRVLLAASKEMKKKDGTSLPFMRQTQGNGIKRRSRQSMGKLSIPM